MFLIKFEYGNNVSGVLPETFETEEDALDRCELENKQYNNVNHFVVNCDEKTCRTCCYHINDTMCDECTDFSKYEVI